MDVSIIIVSYNTADLLDACIDSIKSQTTIQYEIIVVDNHSSDNTLEILKTKHAGVTCIKNNTNNGFAQANNQGIEIANGRYIFLLNPDTLILHRAVDKLFQFMEEEKNIGICSPKNLDKDLNLQFNCDHFPSLWNIFVEYFQLGKAFPAVRLFNRTMMRYWDYSAIRDVDRMTGCSLMIRRSIIDAIGKLDQNYFMYFEETDYCKRVKHFGYRIVFFPNASIIHYGGQSALQVRKIQIVNTTIMNYYLSSRYYYFRKHSGIVSEIILRLLDVFYGCLVILKNTYRKNGHVKQNRLSKANALIRYGLRVSPHYKSYIKSFHQ